MKTLRIEFGFGVGQDKTGTTISKGEYDFAKCVLSVEAAKAFGGYTWTDVHGGWIDKSDDRFFQEPAVTIAVLVPQYECGWVPDGDSPILETLIRDFADHIKRLLNQRAVYVVRSTVDAELY